MASNETPDDDRDALVRRVSYGSDVDQWADLYLPASHRAEDGGQARTAVLVHGGFWQSRWTATLMDPMAEDLAARGWIVWNLEYRRPDRWSWAETAEDISCGIAALGSAFAEHRPGDRPRVIGFGHSAGAQLVVRAAADQGADTPVRVDLAVSLAGIVDLVGTERRDLGDGAVRRALGGTPDELPQTFAESDPSQRLPLGIPQLVVQGLDDSPDLVEMSRGYAETALRSGDVVSLIEQPGDHFAVIDPSSLIWRATLAAVDELLQRPPPGQYSRGVTTDTTVVT